MTIIQKVKFINNFNKLPIYNQFFIFTQFCILKTIKTPSCFDPLGIMIRESVHHFFSVQDIKKAIYKLLNPDYCTSCRREWGESCKHFREDLKDTEDGTLRHCKFKSK